MLNFFKAGGWSMIVVLLFGLLTLASAAAFMRKPEERHIGMIRGLSVATVFAILSGITANLAAVFSNVPSHPKWSQSPDLHLIVMAGLGEALTPCILGFTMLSLAWLVTAVGVRRLGALEPA